MYSQEFDSSEFDYLNAGNFSETENQTQTKTPEITNIERFWNLTGTGENSAVTSARVCLHRL
jgi:hypothetical protein